MTLPTALVRVVAIVVAALGTVVLGARHAPVVPELVLLPVLAVGVRSGSLAGASWGLAAGWIADLLPPGSVVLGSDALLYAVIGAVVGRFRRVDRPRPTWLGWVSLLGSGAVESVRALTGLARGIPVDWAGSGWRILVTALVGALVLPGLLALGRSSNDRRP